MNALKMVDLFQILECNFSMLCYQTYKQFYHFFSIIWFCLVCHIFETNYRYIIHCYICIIRCDNYWKILYSLINIYFQSLFPGQKIISSVDSN